MKETKKLRKEIDEWISKNGACDVNIKDEDIILFDGGLFWIDSKKVKRHKVMGYKKVKGGSQIIFSKKKIVNDIENKVILWIGELDSTINYLTRLRNLLNKKGFNTRRDIRDLSKDKK